MSLSVLHCRLPLADTRSLLPVGPGLQTVHLPAFLSRPSEKVPSIGRSSPSRSRKTARWAASHASGLSAKDTKPAESSERPRRTEERSNRVLL
jgi:hypothetical protein